VSYALDANILLYASDATSEFHSRAVTFLENCAADDEVLVLAWPTVMAYLRIATHPAVFDHPLEANEALANVENLLRLPQARVLSEGPEFFALYRELADAHAPKGNLVPDAHLACLLRSNGVKTLYTLDRGFRRFDFLRVERPWD